MFDVATLGAALASAKAILDLLKNANDAQLAIKISGEVAQIQGRLIDVQQQVLAIQTENSTLRDENDRLKAHTFHHSVIWRQLPDGLEDGPFCPLCITDGKATPLMPNTHADQSGDAWHLQCPVFHVPQGRGWERSYTVPKSLISPERFHVK